MKFYKSTLYLSFALSLSLSPLSANPELWQKHIEEISELVKINPDEARENQAQIDTSLRTIKMSLAAEDFQQAVTQLNTLRNLEPKAVKPILELSEKLIDLLVEQSKEDIKNTEKLYTEFAEATMAAKLPSEIDPWIKKLNDEVKKAQTLNRSIGPLQVWTPHISHNTFAQGYQHVNRQNQLFNMNCSNLVFLQSKSSQALQIAQYWQDYLHHKMNDDVSSAKNDLSRISQLVINFTYIPRSKVLAMQSGLPSDNNNTEAIAKLKMDDLRKRLGSQEEALLLYHELRHVSSSRLTPAVRELSSKLQEYSSACAYLEGGDIDDGFYKIRTLIYHPILGSLSKNTHDKFLNRYVKIPADFKKKDGEEGAEWMTRYILKLSKDKAWKELHLTLIFMQQYYYRSGGYGKAPLKEDLEAISNLRAGMNYEANQQYMRAIVAYRQAVGTLGYCTEVVTEAGKHLLELQKDHPTEFAQSQSLRSHDGTSSSFTTSHLLLRKIVKEELKKKDEPADENKDTE